MSNEHLIFGKLTADEFLTDYWQKKPLLIRDAIPDFVSPINGDDLAAMSLESEIESRLIIGDDYQLEHGPFDETRFQELPEDNWTLLVQAVDLWVPEVAKLRDYFNLPLKEKRKLGKRFRKVSIELTEKNSLSKFKKEFGKI